jgi:hypothetical protein
MRLIRLFCNILQHKILLDFGITNHLTYIERVNFVIIESSLLSFTINFRLSNYNSIYFVNKNNKYLNIIK